MNKYEEYLDMKEFFDAVLSGSNYAIKEYYRKKDIQDKKYLCTKFRDSLLRIIDNELTKNNEEKIRLIFIFKEKLKCITNINNSVQNKNYSDSDIEYLRQYTGFDLTLEEACLIGKRDEYYNFLRLVIYKMGNINGNLEKKIKDEIQSLNGDYTPRLIWEFYKKHKKGRNN